MNRGSLRLRGCGDVDVDDAPDAPRSRLHHHDPVAEVDRLVDVVGDQQHGDALGLPDALQLVLQPRARQRIERAERLVEQQHAAAG